MILALTTFIVLAITPTLSFACDCSSGPLYKGFPLNEDTGYSAREFDKYAPTPGLDWEDTGEFWFMDAYQKGWITKSSPQDASPGAIILFKTKYSTRVGIVREVTSKGICFEVFSDQHKITSYEATFDSLIPNFHFIGYIWPEKQKLTAKKKLVIP